MKIWKKKTKNDEVIIMQPKSKGKTKARDTSTDRSSVESKKNIRSSESSIPSNSERKTSNPRRDSASDHSDDDDDYSDSFTDDSIDDLDSIVFDLEKKPKKPKKQRKPIVNSCCGFCSLGAGSLITGLLYIVSSKFCYLLTFLWYIIELFTLLAVLTVKDLLRKCIGGVLCAIGKMCKRRAICFSLDHQQFLYQFAE